MSSKVFADSYALIELMNQNPLYKPYKEADMVLLQGNLAEVLYACLKEDIPFEQILAHLLPSVIPLTASALVKAMEIRFRLRKRHLSYIDCLGYATALELNIPFLTGDEGFIDLPGVEFIA